MREERARNNSMETKETGVQFEELKACIDRADDCIREILDKTKNLDKIESQQKILALNASIEAARAGDAGKGFAIVATKVGELASSSAAVNSSIKQSLEDLDRIILEMKKLEKQQKGSEKMTTILTHKTEEQRKKW